MKNNPTPKGERIQKVLAQQGVGSRREVEAWIEAGDILINGRVAELGDRYSPGDTLTVKSRPVQINQQRQQRTRVLAYYKTEGELTTRHDPEGRDTVFDCLPSLRDSRWLNIGRLDCNTTGLLLFTTNGELAHRLMHPSFEVAREYAVRVLGEVNDNVLMNLRKGVELEDGMAAFLDIRDGGGDGANHWYHVTLKEGRNREVRRLWESQGIQVSRLIRTRYGDIRLPRGLPRGRYKELDARQVTKLAASVGLELEGHRPRKPHRRPKRK